MQRAALIAGVLVLSQCGGDETVRSYGASDKEWTLVELDGVAFAAPTTLTFPEPGRISGRAPCNSYQSTMTAPYPWFETGPVAATKMACPRIAEETAFLTALAQMTQSEVSGDTLILSNQAGREMVFRSAG